jgi:hypothetical protein
MLSIESARRSLGPTSSSFSDFLERGVLSNIESKVDSGITISEADALLVRVRGVVAEAEGI